MLASALTAIAVVVLPQAGAVGGAAAEQATGSPTPQLAPLLPRSWTADSVVSAVSEPAPAPGSSAPAAQPVSNPAPAAEGLASALAADGIPQTALDAYRSAAAAMPAACHLSWPLLAAIGRVESDHGRFAGAVLHADGHSEPPILGPVLNGQGTARIADTDQGRLDGDTVYDRAVGPMQFIPATWAIYGRTGAGSVLGDPFDIHDAAQAAARYLCLAGGDLSAEAGQARAVFAYNHSDAYVATVLTLAAGYAHTAPPAIPVTAVELTDIPPVDPAPHVPQVAAPSVLMAPIPAATPTPALTATPTPTPAITTPPTTTAPTTAPPTTTAPTTTAPTTTAPTTTAPTTTAPTTTAPTTTAPTTTATGPTESPTPTPTESPTPTPTPTESSACTAQPTGGPKTVDILDLSGDPAIAATVSAALTAAGFPVGHVTRTAPATGTPRERAIEYPAAQLKEATRLATALHAKRSLREANVETVTLLLTTADPRHLVAALTQLPGACAASATTTGGG